MNSKIRVLTLSAQGEEAFLQRLLEPIGDVSVNEVDISRVWSQEGPLERAILSRAPSPEKIAQLLAEVIYVDKKSSRLILSFDESLWERMNELLDAERSMFTFEFISINGYKRLESVAALAKPGLTIIATVFGQVSQWWAHQTEDASVTVYSGRTTPQDFVKQGDQAVRLVEGAQLGGFVACAIDLGQIGMMADHIIGCFVRDPLLVKGMKDSLTAQGLISDNRLTLSNPETLVFWYLLSMFAYDYRLAMFVALLSNHVVRRTKMQFAATIVSDSICCLCQSGSVRREAADTVFRSCFGFGRGLAKSGSTWVDLGLVEYLHDQKTRRPSTADAVDGIIDIREEVADRIQLMSNSMMKSINNMTESEAPEPPVSTGACYLAEDEKRQLHQHLFQAYMHQLIRCRKSLGGEPMLTPYGTMTRCKFPDDDTHVTTLLDLSSLIEEAGNAQVFGISHAMKRLPSGDIEIHDWVMIPSDIFAC
ncbi:hypothetical protein FLONG3_6894 [Fusarium longipes]|uniref:Uncharacterized protein n=1 Tax=Fusarium longipes TaxID=694270 RepID=A0A395SII0_9HYPO|nr:hypothetical protein FLONG3_6894 [Fusarium longipes]